MGKGTYALSVSALEKEERHLKRLAGQITEATGYCAGALGGAVWFVPPGGLRYCTRRQAERLLSLLAGRSDEDIHINRQGDEKD